ncbi:MAG: hypothetical protein HFH94_01390 [Lachnospiraceae bacterium]|jgi:hypothetical protein|nr:hypothetical protein [Lachnospiraceae bacterium]
MTTESTLCVDSVVYALRQAGILLPENGRGYKFLHKCYVFVTIWKEKLIIFKLKMYRMQVSIIYRRRTNERCDDFWYLAA